MPFDEKTLRLGGAPLRVLPAALEGASVAMGGAQLLDQVTLSLEPGAPTALMGPNGAGKSLCLRLFQGLIPPSAGAVSFAGRTATREARRRVALVFQRPVLLRRSVAANLDHALRVFGASRAERPERIAALLSLARLSDLAGRPARVLSGGEQQRLAMVRALAAEPQLLLLDEPTASLDPQATQAIETLIADAAARGVKVLLVTHDPGQARRLAEDVAFLHRGRVVERTPAATFFERPQSDAAQAYLAGRLLV